MRCPSCKGAFPEGCSACRPMPVQAMRCGEPNPSALNGAAFERDFCCLFRGHYGPHAADFHYWSDPPAETFATEHGSARAHTCPQCMRGLPCDPSSLSSLVGQIATRKPSEADWKGREFGAWDANGSPVGDGAIQ